MFLRSLWYIELCSRGSLILSLYSNTLILLISIRSAHTISKISLCFSYNGFCLCSIATFLANCALYFASFHLIRHSAVTLPQLSEFEETCNQQRQICRYAADGDTNTTEIRARLTYEDAVGSVFAGAQQIFWNVALADNMLEQQHVAGCLEIVVRFSAFPRKCFSLDIYARF